MKYSVDKQDRFSIFSLMEDKLNSLIAPDLKTELVILNNEGYHNVIVDLAQVNFIDSSGLSALLVGNRLCQKAGGCLILTNLTDNVHRLIKISQLDSILDIIGSIPESRDLIMMRELEKELKGEAPASTEEDSEA